MFILAGALALPAQEPRAGAIQATGSPEPLPSKVFVPSSKQRQQEIKRLSGETILGSSIFTCPAQKELPPNGKTETRGGRPVMYTHFHQAGGTTMCRLANQLKNQEKMGDKQRGEQNCNLDADRLVTPQGTSVTCAERIDMCGPYFEGAEMKWRNVTWMQQERWVDADSCSALYYVAMLRDPLDRIVSNMYAMWQHGRDPAVVNATRVLSMLEPGAATFYDKQHGEWSTAAFDNYFVRVLGGNDVYWLPAGAVNRTHLDTAKQVLQRYQVIMTLDTFDEDALQMSELLGWTVTALDMPEGGIPTLQQLRSAGTGAGLPFPFSEEQLQALSSANALDYELLCFARSMRGRRLDEARRLRSSKLARRHQSQSQEAQGQAAAVAAGKADWRSGSAMQSAQAAQAAELDETYLGWMEQAAKAQPPQQPQAQQAQQAAQAQRLSVARSSSARGDGTWTEDDVPQVFVGDDGTPTDEEPDEARAPAPAAGAVQAPAPVNTDPAPVQAPAPLATDALGNPILPAAADPVAAEAPVEAGPRPVLSDGGLGAAAAANGASAAAQGAIAAAQGALGPATVATAPAAAEPQEPAEEPRLLSDGGVAAAAAAMGAAASASPAIARGEEPAKLAQQQQQQPEAPALTGDPAADAANKAFADAAAAAAKTHAEEAARNEASAKAAAAAKADQAAHPNIISDDPGSCRTIITTVNDQWCQATCGASCPSTHCVCDS